MKRILALSGMLALTGCASVLGGTTPPVFDSSTGAAVAARPLAAPAITSSTLLDDVPLKLMSPSQSAARVN